MTLEMTLKIAGWALTGIPVTIFIFVSAAMIYKVGKEDDTTILMLASLGVISFFIGVGILALVYLGETLF